MFDQWVQRHRRCILHRGEYFEKKWNCVLTSARSGETNEVGDVAVGRLPCSETAKGTSLDERYLFNYMCELFEIYKEKRRKTAVSCHIIFVFLRRKNFLSEQKSTLFLNSLRTPMYKIWIQYTNLFKRYWTETIFQSWKRAITPIIIGEFYPKWNLTYISWLYIWIQNAYLFKSNRMETIFVTYGWDRLDGRMYRQRWY